MSIMSIILEAPQKRGAVWASYLNQVCPKQHVSVGVAKMLYLGRSNWHVFWWSLNAWSLGAMRRKDCSMFETAVIRRLGTRVGGIMMSSQLVFFSACSGVG
jgi:hypothetical protein